MTLFSTRSRIPYKRKRRKGGDFSSPVPFGYLECTEDSQVNLSIRKTYIDRVARDKAYIKGEIRNLDDKTIAIILITFNLSYADGDQIATPMPTIDYLLSKNSVESTPLI